MGSLQKCIVFFMLIRVVGAIRNNSRLILFDADFDPLSNETINEFLHNLTVQVSLGGAPSSLLEDDDGGKLEDDVDRGQHFEFDVRPHSISVTGTTPKPDTAFSSSSSTSAQETMTTEYPAFEIASGETVSHQPIESTTVESVITGSTDAILLDVTTDKVPTLEISMDVDDGSHSPVLLGFLYGSGGLLISLLIGLTIFFIVKNRNPAHEQVWGFFEMAAFMGVNDHVQNGGAAAVVEEVFQEVAAVDADGFVDVPLNAV